MKIEGRIKHNEDQGVWNFEAEISDSGVDMSGLCVVMGCPYDKHEGHNMCADHLMRHIKAESKVVDAPAG